MPKTIKVTTTQENVELLSAQIKTALQQAGKKATVVVKQAYKPRGK